MANNIYEVLATRNAALAKFTDENEHVAMLFKKIIGLVVNIAEERHCDASKIMFEPHAAPDGKFIFIAVKLPPA